MNQQRRSRELERADQRAPVSQTNITIFDSLFSVSFWGYNGCTIIIPRVILVCLYKEPQKNQKATHRKPQNPIQGPYLQNPNPQTTINEENEDTLYRVTRIDRRPKWQEDGIIF